MTRIHKKPGSKAWKKSIKKSASRMARDFMRAPENKQKAIMLSWMKNKASNPQEALCIGKSFEKMLEKCVEDTENAFKKRQHLHSQMERILVGIKGKVKKLKRSAAGIESNLKGLKNIRNIDRLILGNLIADLRQVQTLEKFARKEAAEELKKERAKLEGEIKKNLALLGELDILIAEEEKKHA